MVFLVTYDLNKPGKDYSRLYASLRQYDYIRDPVLDSAWFVSTSWSSAQIYEHLRHSMDRSDRLFITQIQAGGHSGWMHKNVWAWINARL